MPTELLFDTSAVIDIYKGRDRVRPYFTSMVNGTLRPYLSVITEAEMWRGLREGELDQHNLLISQFNILPLTSEAARLAGDWMREYKSEGLGWMDALISAIALTNRLGVLTRDKKLIAVLDQHVKFTLYG